MKYGIAGLAVVLCTAAILIFGIGSAGAATSTQFCVDGSTVTLAQPTAPDVVAEPVITDYEVYGLYIDANPPFIHFGWHFANNSARNAYQTAEAQYEQYQDDLAQYNADEAAYESQLSNLNDEATNGGYFENGVPHTVTSGACDDSTPVDTSTTPTVVVEHHDSGSQTCYSVGGTPKTWDTAGQAEAALESGNWLPVAVEGNVLGGTNVGEFHLVCRAPLTGALPDAWADNNGAKLDKAGALATGLIGVYPIES
jgi:hypothetical protein